MGRIVANFFISFDGVVESPNLFVGPYFDDAVGAVIGSGMATQRAFLLGRKLYDEWSQHWPTSTDEPFASYINGLPKYVVSDTLTEAGWSGTTVIRGDQAAERLRELKESTDGDIGMSGSATTVGWLLSQGLLDELALLVFPVVRGAGQRLFADGEEHTLRLLASTALPTGVLHLRYAPV